MYHSRWLLIPLAIALLAGFAPPAQAEETPASANNVVSIDLGDGELPTLLSAEEADRIRLLMGGAGLIVPLTPVSPDNEAVLAAVGDSGGFLNIQDGTITPLSSDAFNRYFPLAILGLGGFAWSDGRTLVSLGLDNEAQSEADALVLLQIDRVSGDVRGTPIRLPAGASPGPLAPNASRLLIVFEEEVAEEGGMAARLRVAPPLPRGTLLAPSSSWLRAEGEAVLKRFPQTTQALRLFQLSERGIMQASTTTLRVAALDLTSGREQEMLTLPPNAMPLGLNWSQDGSRIALTFAGLYDLDSPGRPTFDGALLSDQIYRDATGQLPPEENPFFQNNTVEVFDFANGERQTLRAADTPGGPLLLGADFSPDNQTLLVQALHPGRLAGRRYPVYFPQFTERVSFRFYDRGLQETGRLEARELSSPQGTVAYFVSADELIVSGLVGTNLHPYYYNRVSGEFRNIADRAGAYGFVLPTRSSRQLVFVHSSYTSPPDMYRVNWDGTGLARLTWVNEELKQEFSLREDPVSFRLRDGSLRYGTLIQRGDASYPPKNVPLVVWQEGGPGVAMVNQWVNYVEAPFGLLPSFDIAVLVVPLAGRPGYGAETYNLLYDSSNFGQRDIDEMAEIARTTVANGWTSPSRLGITGCSYGGYFAWQSVIRYPDLYAAANPQCAIVDLFVEWSRGFQFLIPYVQRDTPFESPEEYRRDSPIYNANKIKAAVLSFHGTDDFLPITQNENLHLQLVQRGATARMLKFVGAPHGLVAIPEYEIYAAQEQILWFREHLR